MDAASHKFFESTTHRALHAHSFSRSSSQASGVLTDLLSRYLQLLASSCVKYAQHAGRASITIRDAVCALDELGVGVDELSEYCTLEGMELGRHYRPSARRIEELSEFKSHFVDGLNQERGDMIYLEYTRIPTPPPDDENEAGRDGEEGEVTNEGADNDVEMVVKEGVRLYQMPVDSLETAIQDFAVPLSRGKFVPYEAHHPFSPPLPLSPPLSNPSSPIPSRKRSRNLNWQPPAHIPDFLPPFPTITNVPEAPSSPSAPQSPQPLRADLPLTTLEGLKTEKAPIQLSQPSTSTSTDYLTQIPYSQSSLASVSERHLPGPRQKTPPPRASSQASLPQTEPALFAAYYHLLTNRPGSNPPPSTLARHKVAMALHSHTQNFPRWDPPDTMFSGPTPCPPASPYVSPTYPLQIGDKGEGGKEKEYKFPQLSFRPVTGLQRISPSITRQTSRLPDIARQVLPSTILARTSRLAHPPVLYRGNKALVYGNGISAQWNSGEIPEVVENTTNNNANGVANGKPKESIKVLIPDARMYATWDFEPKDFRTPLSIGARNRKRMNSSQNTVAQSAGTTSISLGGRGRSNSKFG